MILDPPKAEVGAVYRGKVVNVTKFGAFVNILPGRDGLVHISKLGRGKRVERVEDVVDLGDEIEVRVDDIDPQGKVSLSVAGDPAESAPAPASRSKIAEVVSEDAEETVSFEATWEAEAAATFGDLGPDTPGAPAEADSSRSARRNPRRRRN